MRYGGDDFERLVFPAVAKVLSLHCEHERPGSRLDAE
jgi:hypothetical protein